MSTGVTATTNRRLPRALVQSVIDSCKSLRQLQQAHAYLLRRDPSPLSQSHALLLSSYGLSPLRHLPSAESLFSITSYPSLFHYNTIIRAFSKQPLKAISHFSAMLRCGISPNNFTYPFIIKACASCPQLRYGLVIHARVIEFGFEADPYIQSSLIHMYVERKDLHSARQVLEECSERQCFSWNSMIDGYVKDGQLEEAKSLFNKMVCRDIVSWNTMINGFALMGRLDEAKRFFNEMPEKNLVSWNTMLAGYTKCGDVEGARKVFLEMPCKDVLSWNTMLACYAQSGWSNEAVVFFNEMKNAGISPTESTIVSLLSAFAHLGALDQGAHLHAFIMENKMELNTILATALVDMYAKCGSIKRAIQIFNEIDQRDVLAWNTIICGLAMHGHARDALGLFNKMILSGNLPDDITFVALLSACSHSGMVEEGRRLFESMKSEYGVDPKVEHFGCVVDLLARAGMFEDALELTENMPMEPNPPAWGALLGGCRIHEKFDIGEDVGKHLLDLQPEHSGRYVLLSNIYATANRWEDASTVRSMMVSNGVAKIPGMSMIEFKGIVYQFVAGDHSQPDTEAIYIKLAEISERLKVESGYSPDTKQVLLDIEEEEKQHSLLVHSEKLAIAFGLLHTCTEEVIRVVKNLRVCRDCHNFAKLVSMVYRREIIMRDRTRFHLFKEGMCSCTDYW